VLAFFNSSPRNNTVANQHTEIVGALKQGTDTAGLWGSARLSPPRHASGPGGQDPHLWRQQHRTTSDKDPDYQRLSCSRSGRLILMMVTLYKFCVRHVNMSDFAERIHLPLDRPRWKTRGTAEYLSIPRC
jgi:hypothetical protein